MSLQLFELVVNSGRKDLTREEILALDPGKDYNDGRTQQSFKDETDINRIMERAQVTGTISHLNKYEAKYADFSDFDFFESQRMLTAGRVMFDQMPSETRNEFDNSPQKFFDYVNDPENKGRLHELLPALAKPGKQKIDVSGKTPPSPAPSGAPSELPASETPPAEPPASEQPADTPPAQ